MRRKASVGGVAVEVLAAAGALVLAILGLVGLFPVEFAAVAAISGGAALLFEGLTVAASLRPHSSALAPHDPATGDVGVEALAGLAGVTLGILALAGVATFVLLPVAAIVLGGGLVFGSHPLLEVKRASEVYDGQDAQADVIHRVAASAPGIHVFAGLAAVVLGIVGVVVGSVVTYSLIGSLVIGATVMLGSAAVGGRLASAIRH